MCTDEWGYFSLEVYASLEYQLSVGGSANNGQGCSSYDHVTRWWTGGTGTSSNPDDVVLVSAGGSPLAIEFPYGAGGYVTGQISGYSKR